MEPEQASLFEKQQQKSKPIALPDSFANEYNAYALLEGRLRELLAAWRLPADCIYTATNKDTFVVKFNDRVLWRMRFKSRVHYISIREQFIQLLPDGTEHSKPSQGFIRLPADGPQDIQCYADLLLQITEKTILSVPTDFDCCASYEACSNVGHCVGNNPATCGYNRVLRSGKIYYGKNRNIDEMGNIRKSN